MLERSKGITLIALVVTIIVLLILAGVTLSFVAGENGILKRATNAVEENKEATAKEQVELLVADYKTQWYEEKYVNRNEVGNQKDYLLDEFQKGANTEDYYVKTGEEEIVNVYEGKDNTGNHILSFTIKEDGSIEWKEKVDKKGIDIRYSMTPNGYTNQNVILTIKASSTEGNITNLEVPSSWVKNEDGNYKITQNGNYEVTATDSTGATKTTTIQIQKIDKAEPLNFTISKDVTTDDKIKIVANVEDAEESEESVKSGIGKYEYYINGEKYESTEPNYSMAVEEGKRYENIYVIAYDRAGNQKRSENVLSVGRIIYVSNEGNDATGNGNSQKPLASILNAINKAESGDSIKILAGNYSITPENVLVQNGVRVDVGLWDHDKELLIVGENEKTILYYDAINTSTAHRRPAIKIGTGTILRNLTVVFTPQATDSSTGANNAIFYDCKGTVENVFFRTIGSNVPSYLYGRSK